MIIWGEIAMKRPRKNFFCRICRQFAEHVFYMEEWNCCHCNPLMLEDANLPEPVEENDD